MRRLPIKKLWLHLYLLVGLTGNLCSFAAEQHHKIDNAVKPYIEQQAFQGVVLVGQAGQTLYRRALGQPTVGMTDTNSEQPITPDMPFQIGSVTKQFTALLIMQLVEQGGLVLENSLADLFPEQCSSADMQTITVQHLLQHTSGIEEFPDETAYLQTRFAPAVIHQQALQRVCTRGVEWTPGSRFRYNNLDYLVLGAIIEAQLQQPFEQVLQQRILDPLTMQHTGMANGKTNRDDFAQDYFRTASGLQPGLDIRWENYGAAGAMYSHVDDLHAWVTALMNFTLLSEHATTTMFTSDPGKGYVAFGSWVYPAPVGIDDAPLTLVERQGQVGGYESHVVFAPEDKTVIIVLSNVSPAPFEHPYLGQGMAFDILQAVH